MTPQCIPHTRGGEPGVGKQVYDPNMRIPHTRGGEPHMLRGYLAQPLRIPHTRGGEPPVEWLAMLIGNVFPTRVGVNRRPPTCWPQSPTYSPHAWG